MKKKMKKNKVKQHSHPDGIIREYNRKLSSVYSNILQAEIESKILSRLDDFIVDGILNRFLLDRAIIDLKKSMAKQNFKIKQAARQSLLKASKYNMRVLKSQLKQIEGK